MIWKEDSVLLHSIFTEDDTYKITTEENLEALSCSINNDGLINPPILKINKAGYTVISGFRRINAIKNLGRNNLTARILSQNTTGLECARLAISDNSFQRSLNLIECLRCYKMLSCYFEESELPQAAFKLGLYDNPVLIKKIMKLSSLPSCIYKYILSDSLSLAMALELTGSEYKQIETVIADIFDQLKLSLNKQREFLTLCREIAIREEITIADIIKGDDFLSILCDEHLDRNQKTHAIRTYLKKRRFPLIKKAESDFLTNVTNLGLIEGIKLIPPAGFEGNSFTITLEFKKITDLYKQTAYLNKLVKNPVMEKILLKDKGNGYDRY